MGNSESNSRNDQVPPEKPGDSSTNLRDRMLMNGGGCKVSYTASDEAEKKEEVKPFSTMWECMEAHSDYYHPYLAAAEAGGELMHVSLDNPQLSKIMEGGACKELWRASEDCADKDSPKYTAMMVKCMEDHSDHYRDILRVFKAGAKLILKELEPSLPNKGDKSNVRVDQFMKGGPCKESYTAWNDSVRRSWKQAGFNLSEKN